MVMALNSQHVLVAGVRGCWPVACGWWPVAGGREAGGSKNPAAGWSMVHGPWGGLARDWGAGDWMTCEWRAGA